MTTQASSSEQRARRGFAAMDPARQRQIASRGGHAAHERGTAHEFNAEEAREAGRRGGEAVSRDRAHMARIGRAGGRRSYEKRRAKSVEPPPSEAPESAATTKTTTPETSAALEEAAKTEKT